MILRSFVTSVGIDLQSPKEVYQWFCKEGASWVFYVNLGDQDKTWTARIGCKAYAQSLKKWNTDTLKHFHVWCTDGLERTKKPFQWVLLLVGAPHGLIRHMKNTWNYSDWECSTTCASLWESTYACSWWFTRKMLSSTKRQKALQVTTVEVCFKISSEIP